jgi:CheY-like chemotaxis protein
MPARIVVVHDDPEFIDITAAALTAAGHDVLAFTSSMTAIDALEAAQQIEVLVTRVIFPNGQPNGVSLALMARTKKPRVKVLFVALPETQEHTAGVGESSLRTLRRMTSSRASAQCCSRPSHHAGRSSRTVLTSLAIATGFDKNLSWASSARRLSVTGHSAAR